MPIMMMTNTSTTPVKVKSSRRVGVTTFFSSAMTCRMKRAIRANGLRRAARSRLAVATTSSLGSSITLRATLTTLSADDPTHSHVWDLQGGQDSNLQPAVLETAALPIEPPPYVAPHPL